MVRQTIISKTERKGRGGIKRGIDTLRQAEKQRENREKQLGKDREVE